MALRYSINYMDTHAGGGFRLFSFRRSRRTLKCGKCKVERAIITMTNNDDAEDNIDLCVTCYNTYPAEQLLQGNKEEEEEKENTL
ncbi:MAG: hypothetical protein ACW981_20545 [Candidatus Hodarchaeales archaeon]